MSSKKPNGTRIVQKRKRKFRKKLYFILVPLLVVIIGAVSYATYLYVKADSALSGSYEHDDRDKSELRENAVDPNIDNVSILIMGVDASDIRENDDSSRTDTLMVATLNKDDKSVKLLSIPRDSYVYIPEVGYESKINHAHAYGGTEATIGTVENLLDIPIDYYVKVNFEAFIDVVDALDGINFDVPYDFSEQDSEDKADAIQLKEGEQKLDGEQALALARTRKMDNDLERGKRQQEVIKAIVHRAVSVHSILKYDDIIEAIGSNMTTNMTFSEMKSFISYGTKGKDLDFDTMTLDGFDYQPGSAYYWQVDEDKLLETQKILKKHLEIEDSSSQEDEDDTNNEEDGEYDENQDQGEEDDGSYDPNNGQEEDDGSSDPNNGQEEDDGSYDPNGGQEEDDGSYDPNGGQEEDDGSYDPIGGQEEDDGSYDPNNG